MYLIVFIIINPLVARIAMVKQERGRALEDLMIQGAQSGQLRGSSRNGQVTENDLLQLLNRIESSQSEDGSETKKISYQRRSYMDYDNDDDNDDDYF